MKGPVRDSPDVLARIEEGLAIVDALARRMKRELGPAAALDDLVAYGREGLLGAARTFDASRGVPFRSWAALRARGAMIDGMRSGGALPRRLYRQLRAMEAGDHVQATLVEEAVAAGPITPQQADDRLSTFLGTIATAMAVGFLASSPDALDADDEAASPEAQVAHAELLARVRESVAKLPDAERTLVERHYFGDLTIDEAARELGLSKSWGSRLHARAVESLAKDLRRRNISE